MSDNSDEEYERETLQIIEGTPLSDSVFEDRVIEVHIDDLSNPPIRISRDGRMTCRPQYAVLESGMEDAINSKTKVEDPPDDTENDPIVTNKRPLSKHAMTYELETFKKNALLVFNHENIDGYNPRDGTDKDVEALTKTFENFLFDVTVRNDFTEEEVFKEMDDFFSRDFSDYGCIGVVVLTHGNANGYIRAKDKKYNQTKILNYFKTSRRPTLVTKPKLFIVQACRGTESTRGVVVAQAFKAKVSRDFDAEPEPLYLPEESDILMLYSSYMGKPSFREHESGSWLIQTLCEKINKLARTVDLESILTEVKKEVALNKSYEEFDRKEDEVLVQKQMPITVSTLTRLLFLMKPENMTTSDKEFISKETTQLVTSEPTPLHKSPSCTNKLCFLEHFRYTKNVLKYFVEENPLDVMAQSYLKIADAHSEEEKSHLSETLLVEICNYLREQTKDHPHSKFIRFYEGTM